MPSSLLAASLPETGGPGAMTPSSTRAEAGEEVTEFSPPSTPTANPEMPQDDDMVRSDLTPHNLPANAVAANPMFKNLQNNPAPSITSSMASQYDSKGGDDQTKMLADVSGVSTPTGTPRAAHRDLEGSLAGSARGEGSVADMDDLGNRLEGMDVKERDYGAGGETKDSETENPVKGELIVDRVSTPEPTDHLAEISHDEAKKIEDDQGRFRDDKGNLVQDKGDNTFVTGDMDDDAEALQEEKGFGKAERVPERTDGGNLTHDPSGVLNNPEAEIEYTIKNEDQPDKEKPHTESTSDDRDPNEDDDLDALKRGELHRPNKGDQVGTHTVDQNPVNNLVEATLSQNVAEYELSEDETKHQGGVAGQRMEDVENADEVIQPDEGQPPRSDGGPDIREATPVSSSKDEKLGEKGTLDGPQKFEVEWLEKGRGQSKAVDLDQGEYHWHDNPKGDKHSGPGSKDEGEGGLSKEKSETSQSETKEDSEKSIAKEDQGKNDDKPDTESIQSQGDKAALLPDAPSTEPKTDSTRPTQIHIEPAPIAQPAVDKVDPDSSSSASVPDTSDEPTPSAEINPPKFPAPPSEDPDEVDPISHPQSGTSTPIDPSFVKAFPEVPDEAKPRVEVHVSSPVNTPQKNRENPLEGSTPLADIPGKSKSLSYPDLKGESEDGEEEHKTPEGLSKRLSARRSPKSPLLDDEDPGDFAPGEGWAVVTK